MASQNLGLQVAYGPPEPPERAQRQRRARSQGRAIRERARRGATEGRSAMSGFLEERFSPSAKAALPLGVPSLSAESGNGPLWTVP